MKYQRINTSTLAICTKTSGGYRPQIERDNLDGYGAPEGEQYVENLPLPTDAPEDGYRWARATPTLDGYGWQQVEIPFVLPDPVSMAQFREELSKPAYNNDAGVTLRMIVQQAVEASGIVMLDWWNTAATVDRHNAKVAAMAEALGISGETLDDIFIGASEN